MDNTKTNFSSGVIFAIIISVISSIVIFIFIGITIHNILINQVDSKTLPLVFIVIITFITAIIVPIIVNNFTEDKLLINDNGKKKLSKAALSYVIIINLSVLVLILYFILLFAGVF
jgi:uncharacterized protein with PQ loop repeat